MRLLTMTNTKPYRSRKYLDYVNSLPCSICGGYSENHHIKSHGQGGTSKASDLFTMPLCRLHHIELHSGVMTWEAKNGVQWYYVGLTLKRAINNGVIDIETVLTEIEQRIINELDREMVTEWIM